MPGKAVTILNLLQSVHHRKFNVRRSQQVSAHFLRWCVVIFLHRSLQIQPMGRALHCECDAVVLRSPNNCSKIFAPRIVF